jgi:hypothetical protein
MDSSATGATSFVYGTISATGGAVTAVNQGLPGSGYTPDGTITIVVPKSDVGSPAAGSTLPSVQARTFALQGDYDVYLAAASVDTTGTANYSVVGNSYCS